MADVPSISHESEAYNGLATFLVSVSPVTGSLNSFQLIGYIVFPYSLFAMITPSSFFAVVR